MTLDGMVGVNFAVYSQHAERIDVCLYDEKGKRETARITLPTQTNGVWHGFVAAGRRTRIKICGLTREGDVDAAVAAGADAIGFVLYAKSPRAVTPARAGELAKRLPPFVTPVLLFVNATDEDWREALDAVPQALLQFHGDETPARCRQGL